jgi:hypothetical protein
VTWSIFPARRLGEHRRRGVQPRGSPDPTNNRETMSLCGSVAIHRHSRFDRCQIAVASLSLTGPRSGRKSIDACSARSSSMNDHVGNFGVLFPVFLGGGPNGTLVTIHDSNAGFKTLRQVVACKLLVSFN